MAQDWRKSRWDIPKSRLPLALEPTGPVEGGTDWQTEKLVSKKTRPSGNAAIVAYQFCLLSRTLS
jgi:hypothetical protein